MIGLRIFAAFAVALSSACLPLDRRPPFASASFVHAADAIDHAAAAAPAGHGPYVAGWAREEIRAPQGVPLAGYGDREGAASTGVRDVAAVRAFAIGAGEHRVVLLTADVLLVSPQLVREVRARLADVVAPEVLFFTASHTHSGPGAFVPGLLWELVYGPYDPASFEAVVDAHVRAVRAAVASMAPARIGSAEIQVPDLITNRVEKDGPTDDRLFVLRLEHLGTGRAAAFWSFGCHAVTLPEANLLISADYPGEVAARFEGERLDVVGFAAGGVGSSNPKHERPNTGWIVNPLADALSVALRVARAQSTAEGRLASAQVELPTPPMKYRIDRDTMVWRVPIETLVGMPKLGFGAIAVGDVLFVHLPGELSGELTRAARRQAKKAGFKLSLHPFNGTYIGYVVPRRVYNLDEEEGEEMLHYETHVMTFLGPWGGDLILNHGLRLGAGVRAKVLPAASEDQWWLTTNVATSPR